jgi:hypothetical protein
VGVRGVLIPSWSGFCGWNATSRLPLRPNWHRVEPCRGRDRLWETGAFPQKHAYPERSFSVGILYLAATGPVWKWPTFTEDCGIMRQFLALGLLCVSLAFTQPAHAQGLWLGGPGFGGFGFGGLGFSPYGFGNAAFFGGYPPASFAYPVAVRPVYVARPIVYGSVAPGYVPRPAVRAPLNRAYRRVWRRGW